MMHQIKFIVLAYGTSLFLEDCLNSIKNQSINVDCIIVTSTPNQYIFNLAKKYGFGVNVNCGESSISSDFNFALENSGINLNVLAHQDDIYHPDFAKFAENFFCQKPDCALAFTDISEMINNKIVGISKREIIKKIIRRIAFLAKKDISSPILFRILLSFGCAIPCPTVIYNFRNSTIREFKFSNSFSINLDWDGWSRLSKAKVKFGYIRGNFLIHRIHDGAETQKGLADFRRHKEDDIIFRRYWPPIIAKFLSILYKIGYQ